MNKLLVAFLGLTLIMPSYAEMSYEEVFLTSIHICKDKDIQNEAKNEVKKETKKERILGWKVINCFCDNFKEYSEDEIIRKYMMAIDLGIPQYDMAHSLAKAQECIDKIGE